MRTYRILALAVSALLPTQAIGHVGQWIFPVYELARADLPDVTDGSILDWEDVVPGPSIQLGDLGAITGVGESPQIDPGNLTYQVYLGWSEETQRIYVAVECVDNFYVNDYDGVSLGRLDDNDSVLFMVDGDHSGGLYGFFSEASANYSDEELRHLRGSTAQVYTSIARSPGRHIGTFWSAPWVGESPWVEGGGMQEGEAPSYSLSEFSITPWDDVDPDSPENSTRSVLAEGRIIGFGVTLYDYDDTISRRDNVYVRDGVYNIGGVVGADIDAGMLADGILVGHGDAFEGGSAVVADSWGRIKAGLSRR